MKKIILIIMLIFPALGVSCPEALRYGDPCKPLQIDLAAKGMSVYQQGDTCTEFLLSDGVCPDYLQGGCAARGECKLIMANRKKLQKQSVFSD